MYKSIVLALTPFFILSWLLYTNLVFEENEESSFSQDRLLDEESILSKKKIASARDPSSVEVDKNLLNELKKINQYENQESIAEKLYPFLLDESIEESKRFESLNYVHENYLKNKENYDLYIMKVLGDALNNENTEQAKRVYMLAAMLPVGDGQLLAQSETTLYDLATGNIAWNQELYTYALQFYYVQKKISGKTKSPLGVELIDLAENSEIKRVITRLNNELSR